MFIWQGPETFPSLDGKRLKAGNQWNVRGPRDASDAREPGTIDDSEFRGPGGPIGGEGGGFVGRLGDDGGVTPSPRAMGIHHRVPHPPSILEVQGRYVGYDQRSIRGGDSVMLARNWPRPSASGDDASFPIPAFPHDPFPRPLDIMHDSTVAQEKQHWEPPSSLASPSHHAGHFHSPPSSSPRGAMMIHSPERLGCAVLSSLKSGPRHRPDALVLSLRLRITAASGDELKVLCPDHE